MNNPIPYYTDLPFFEELIKKHVQYQVKAALSNITSEIGTWKKYLASEIHYEGSEYIFEVQQKILNTSLIKILENELKSIKMEETSSFLESYELEVTTPSTPLSFLSTGVDKKDFVRKTWADEMDQEDVLSKFSQKRTTWKLEKTKEVIEIPRLSKPLVKNAFILAIIDKYDADINSVMKKYNCNNFEAARYITTSSADSAEEVMAILKNIIEKDDERDSTDSSLGSSAEDMPSLHSLRFVPKSWILYASKEYVKPGFLDFIAKNKFIDIVQDLAKNDITEEMNKLIKIAKSKKYNPFAEAQFALCHYPDINKEKVKEIFNKIGVSCE
jgi:hypothetical protein